VILLLFLEENSFMKENRKLWHWLVLATLSLIWGTSYILMKKGLESFSSYQVGSLRIFIAFIILLPVAVKNLNKLNRDNLPSVLIIGLLGSGIPAFLFPIAQTRISSSLAGMLNALSPVFTLVIGIAVYKRQLIRSQIAGVFLGLVGAAGLLYNGSLSFNFYGLFVVLATILSGISSNEAGKLKGLNGLQLTSLAFFLISPMAIIYLLFSDLSAALSTQHWARNLGYIAILAVVGTAAALIMFYLLIQKTSPIFATTVTYFIPIVATLWGLTDNEHLTSSMMISLILIFGGVYIINRPGFLVKRIKV
jgi:drug/metabolite transporter (DMT)-like permease